MRGESGEILHGTKGSSTLDRLLNSLDHASLDPDEWPNLCDHLSDLVDGDGALLVPYDTDDRNLAMPHSPRLAGPLANCIELGWHKRDIRKAGVPKAIRTGFVTDHDIIAPEDMDRHPFYDWLGSVGLKWYVGVTFKFDDRVWCAAVNARPQRGAFDQDDIGQLIRLRDSLSLMGKRSALMGHRRVKSMEEAFSSRSLGVAAIGPLGKILFMNQRAEELLGGAELVRNGYLRTNNAQLDRRLSDLVLSAANFRRELPGLHPRPVVLNLGLLQALSIDIVPMPRDFQSVLSGVTALLTIQDVSPTPHAIGDDVRARYSLTAREFEIARHLVTGRRLADAATAMGVSVATARQHLKSIFSKTGTHRQAELVALLTRT